MRTFFFYLGLFFSLFYSRRLSRLIRSIVIIIRSGFRSTEFKKFGKTSTISNNCYIDNASCISVGERCMIQSGSFITAVARWKNGQKFNPSIIIGDYVNIGRYCHISAIQQIVIKSGTRLGSYITILDNSHGKTDGMQKDISPYDRELYSPGGVIIEENVWIGDKATILPNVHIGKSAVIGANAVVTKDIPDYGIAVGCPAKVVGYNK